MNFIFSVTALPGELPTIDWEHYKSKISTPAVVDAFKTKYTSLKIPYPSDQGAIAQIDTQTDKIVTKHKEQTENIAKGIAELTKELEKLKNTLPYSEMNMEEYYEANTADAYNPDKPGVWPNIHDPNYKDPTL